MAGEILYPEFLDDVADGDYTLGVPLLHDVIQVSAAQIDGKAQLVMTKEGGSITIRRDDGHPLQVNVREFSKRRSSSWEEKIETMVFETPADILKLQRPTCPQIGWLMTENTPAHDESAACSFLSVIGYFALQQRNPFYSQLLAS